MATYIQNKKQYCTKPIGRKYTDYKPTKSDIEFVNMMKAFKVILVGNMPTYDDVVYVLGSKNYRTIKRWVYRLSQIPRNLPYGDMKQQSAVDHLNAIAKDIIKLNDAYNQPMSDDSEYLNPDAEPKFVPDEVRNTPLEGSYDFEHEFTDEELKDFKPFPGSE